MAEQFGATLRGRVPDNEYVAHLKVYEFAEGGTEGASHKTRYMVVGASPSLRRAFLYKTRRNANGSFSIGKEWDLSTLKALALEQNGSIVVTFSRAYRWQADPTHDPTRFLNGMAAVFLELEGRLPTCHGFVPGASAPAGPAIQPAVVAPLHPAGGAQAVQDTAVPLEAPHAVPAPAVPNVLATPSASPNKQDIPLPGPLSSLAPVAPVASAPITPAPASPAPYSHTPPAEAATPHTARRTVPASPVPMAPHESPAPAADASRPTTPRVQPLRAPTAVVQAPLRSGLVRPAAAQLLTTAEAPDPTEEHGTLAHVEEMLEGFEWKMGRAAAERRVGTADVIETRLLEELAALEASGIHAMIESDDRVARVLQHMDDALFQLDRLEAGVSGYKRQLIGRAEDIAFIESQNRGLQVQTSNQRVLLHEVEALLSTIHVDQDALTKLAHVGLRDTGGDVAQTESTATSLYKSILQSRPDRHSSKAELESLAARLQQSQAVAEQFNARLVQELSDAFRNAAQAQLSDVGAIRQATSATATLPAHDTLEQALGPYCGLSLYLKETTPALFAQLSQTYLASAAYVYRSELQHVLAAWAPSVFRDEPPRAAGATPTKRPSLQRERSVLGPGRGGDVRAAEVLQRVFASLRGRVAAERAFLVDLLQINDATLSFADYMDMEPYFKNRAAVTMALPAESPQHMMSAALEQVFGGLPAELDAFAMRAAAQSPMDMVGLLAETEHAVRDLAQQPSGDCFERLLGRVAARMRSALHRIVDEQIRTVEQTKLSVKKRTGIVPFIYAFPQFVRRIEAQLEDADKLAVRAEVNQGYERVSRAMFAAIQSLSPSNVGADDDKGQLNRDVIIVENMHHLLKHVRPGTPANPALVQLLRQAQAMYDRSRSSYVQSVLRRPIGRVTDFCQGLEQLLQTLPANEVALHSAYSKSAARKVARECAAKDLRKAIDALSKRVQKHFNDEDDAPVAPIERDELAEVLAQVWTSCAASCTKELERFGRLLQTCYGEGTVPLELSTAEVSRLFQSMPPALRRR